MLPNRPNILILLNDQQRAPVWFPDGWAAKNLPVLTHLQATGVTFENAITNSAACSPASATLFTSHFPQETGVSNVTAAHGELGVTTWGSRCLGSVLKGLGYEVVYKGKWHLTSAFVAPASTRPLVDSVTSDQHTMEGFGFAQWNGPDAGTEAVTTVSSTLTPFSGPPVVNEAFTLAGLPCNNDARIVQEAISFLRDRTSSAPFCLVVSLVNPHDVGVDPSAWAELGYDSSIFGAYGFPLPGNFDVDMSTRPWAQQVYLDEHSPNPSSASARLYLEFYAYLQTLADRGCGRVLDALHARPEFAANTLIVRIADHGEMGMSQGGLRQKNLNAYRETIGVPMTFSHPALPQGVRVQSLAGLVDVLPTLASIAGGDLSTLAARGIDLSRTLADPSVPTQEAVLFTYDDAPPGPPIPMAHIRCVRTECWKYVCYYDMISVDSSDVGACNFQYELYDLLGDAAEITNLLPNGAASTARAIAVQTTLHMQLTALLDAKAARPNGWPTTPPAAAPNPSGDPTPDRV